VLYLSLKSIRTGIVIGTLTTLIMLPFAVLLGIMAGYFKGWVDDVIQYVYTTLSSIPAVLLIAAAILTLQAYMAVHPERFDTTADLAKLAAGGEADICVVPAAISDFAPRKTAGKIPSRRGPVSLELEPTPKILTTLRKHTKDALVGFKAEAGVRPAELKEKALALLKEADLDFVVANDVGKVKGAYTAIVIYDRKGRSEAFEGGKDLAAERIWSAIVHGVPG